VKINVGPTAPAIPQAIVVKGTTNDANAFSTIISTVLSGAIVTLSTTMPCKAGITSLPKDEFLLVKLDLMGIRWHQV
jgi:hypothetical protein